MSRRDDPRSLGVGSSLRRKEDSRFCTASAASSRHHPSGIWRWGLPPAQPLRPCGLLGVTNPSGVGVSTCFTARRSGQRAHSSAPTPAPTVLPLSDHPSLSDGKSLRHFWGWAESIYRPPSWPSRSSLPYDLFSPPSFSTPMRYRRARHLAAPLPGSPLIPATTGR